MDVIERNLFDTCQHFCDPGVLQEGFYQHIEKLLFLNYFVILQR